VNIKIKKNFFLITMVLLLILIIYWYINNINTYKNNLNIKNLDYEISENNNTNLNPTTASEVTFKLKLPENDYTNPSIYFDCITGNNFKVYSSNEIIYEDTSSSCNEQTSFIINIDKNLTEDFLTVKYMSYSPPDKNQKIFMGNYNDLMTMFNIHQLPYIILGCSFLLIFIFMLTGIIFIDKKNFTIWTSISFLMLSFGFLIISINSGFYIVFPVLKNYRVFLGTYSMFILMIALAYFSENIFAENYKKFLRIKRISIISYFLLFLLIDLISTSDLMISRSIMNLIFVIQCLIIFVLTVRFSFRGKKEAQLLMIAFIVFLIPIFMTYIETFKNSLLTSEGYWQIGVLLFSIVLFIILWKKISNMHSDVIKYTSELEILSEKLYRLDKLKDSFLKNTTYEFRTPLQGIIGISETMLSEAKNISNKNADNIKTIIFIAKNLNELIEKIIDLTKIKNKNLFLNTIPVDLWQISEMITEISNSSIDNKNLVIENHIDENIPNVIADEKRLRQILSTLIKNSIKYTDKGIIKITATEEDCWVKISITDEGRGIPKEELKEIFDPYDNDDNHDSKSSVTNKLNLNLTKYLIELHKGSISIKSELGKGTNYTFTIPKIAKETLEQKISYVNSNMITNTDNKSNSKNNFSSDEYSNIIIADKDINIRVIENMLGVDNYNIIRANNGLEVINLLNESFEADLLILNVMLPKMSGYEVCKKIRENKSLYDLPILLTTSKNYPNDSLVGFESGANDYLSRPFYKDELKARVNTLLKLKQSVKVAINAELHFLQSQIKPHFLHNTINTIVSLVKTNPEQARNLLIELSNYLRESFNFRYQKKFFPIEKEINIIKSYLYIEKARYPEKLKIKYDIDKNINLEIPHLLLQPIVENAVKHGILKKRFGGEIKISIKNKDNHIKFNVFDNGIGIDNNRIPILLKGNINDCGVGIVNTNRRLKTIYGSEINIQSDLGKWTNVSINIPFKKKF
jgi:sensor histidine kinase YesM